MFNKQEQYQVSSAHISSLLTVKDISLHFNYILLRNMKIKKKCVNKEGFENAIRHLKIYRKTILYDTLDNQLYYSEA